MIRSIETYDAGDSRLFTVRRSHSTNAYDKHPHHDNLMHFNKADIDQLIDMLIVFKLKEKL